MVLAVGGKDVLGFVTLVEGEIDPGTQVKESPGNQICGSHHKAEKNESSF